ncbi:hypothetical protein E4T56_gene4238 [Termitomyces sp. T112]|nr:hypothetical protein E4T56_gene4238 [Termitomyces sp. T112]KAH0589750.1 hypothetical protein H2248_005470 [Termitomyces sp. 'cryptogamus']
MSLPILVCDEAVGYATNRDSAHIFNDVQTIGGWPSLLQITKVTKIVLHLGEKTVDGIETTYKMADNSVRVSSHGKKMGTTETCTLNDDEFFVGIFGATDQNVEQPILRRIGFVIYNKATGAITTFGPFPPIRGHLSTDLRGFSSLGLIVGFSGSTSSHDKLDTLTIYKFSSGDKRIGLS